MTKVYAEGAVGAAVEALNALLPTLPNMQPPSTTNAVIPANNGTAVLGIKAMFAVLASVAAVYSRVPARAPNAVPANTSRPSSVKSMLTIVSHYYNGIIMNRYL